jgi:uncharacterized protein YeeX (DUF496 family)
MEAHPRSDVESYVDGKTHSHKAMKMLLNSPEATERSSARRLVSRILDPARGVFIWIKLLLENLLDAWTEGAELEELDDIVTSLPDDLEDLYTALMAGVKVQGHHREAYTMLEVLVRAPRLLNLHKFRCIVKCANQGNLKDCVDALKHASPRMSAADIDGFVAASKVDAEELLKLYVTRLQRAKATNPFRLFSSCTRMSKIS